MSASLSTGQYRHQNCQEDAFRGEEEQRIAKETVEEIQWNTGEFSSPADGYRRDCAAAQSLAARHRSCEGADQRSESIADPQNEQPHSAKLGW